MLCTLIVLNVKKKTIWVHNMFSTCSELWIFMYWTRNSMNSLLSFIVLWVSWYKKKCFWKRFTYNREFEIIWVGLESVSVVILSEAAHPLGRPTVNFELKIICCQKNLRTNQNSALQWVFQKSEWKKRASLLLLIGPNTVFPHIVSAETILFWIWKSKGHSTETIKGRKLYEEIRYLVDVLHQTFEW